MRGMFANPPRLMPSTTGTAHRCLESLLVEWVAKQRSTQHIDEVAVGEITGVTAAFDDGLSFARSSVCTTMRAVPRYSATSPVPQA